MRNISHVAIAAMLSLALPLAAQDACTGPGSAFGVVSYQCGNCTMEQRSGVAMTWQFGVEPLILKTADGSAFRSGDIVEAVNGTPITTAAGGQLFTYPASGETEIIVRRGGQRTTLHVQSSADCSKSAALLRLLLRVDSSATKRRVGSDSAIRDSLRDSVNRIALSHLGLTPQQLAQQAIGPATPQQLAQQAQQAIAAAFLAVQRDRMHEPLRGDTIVVGGIGRNSFGFAILCTDCTLRVHRDTSTYPTILAYRTFASTPTIGEVEPDGPAAKGGLRTGDVILAVNGNSVLQDAGAMALARSSTATTLSLTIERKDGTRVTVELKAREVKPPEDVRGRS